MKLSTIVYKFLIFAWKTSPKKLSPSVVKKLPFLQGKLYRDLRFKGIFNVQTKGFSFKLYNPGFTTIENELFWKGIEGGWEKISLDIWTQLCKDSNVILDIGANSGIYSLVASAVNPEAQIFAFEPVNRTAVLFKRNIQINNFNNIELYEKGVSNISGEAIFYDVDTESQSSASLSEKMLPDDPHRITYPVEVVALDRLQELQELKVDLVKLDVEMHEPQAIEGMIEMLRRDRPALLIEILTDEIGKKIEEQLSGLDYLYFNIDEVNPPQRVEKLGKSAYFNFLLCTKEVADKLNLA